MSIAMDAQCIVCHIRRHVATALTLGDEDTATRFAKELLKIYMDAPAGETTVAICPQVDELYRRFYHVGDDRFAAEKAQSNQFVMDRMDTIRSRAEAAEVREHTRNDREHDHHAEHDPAGAVRFLTRCVLLMHHRFS